MRRRMRRPLFAAAALAALALAGCGQEIEVAQSDGAEVRRGAELFNERCSGCHTLEAAAATGSKPEDEVEGGERTNGPNFDVRRESTDDVLYAIRNGGFSGAIMPANIVVGPDADAVAQFVCRYAGGYDTKRDCTLQPVPPLPSGGGGGEGGDQPAPEGGAAAETPESE
jgi:mono/diheme cytochrome c family protein